ncbi:MAG: YheU family protein [Pseudomonadales bacterium]
MIIPWQELSQDALMGVIEEFVTREGTDYGHAMPDLDAKVRQVLRQLRAGDAVLVFDETLDSCSIQPAVAGKVT